MSIRTHYEKELKSVFDNFVLMCRHIEVAIEKCVKAFVDGDVELARAVFEEDNLIDRMERDIEQTCLKILIMEHPVAGDFREVSAALKMITDLERIGDQARDIAEITIHISQISGGASLEQPAGTSLERPGGPDGKAGESGGKAGGLLCKTLHVPDMAVIVTSMVKDSVQAYINRDLELARSLDKTDDKVDTLFNTVMADLIALIKENPDSAEMAILYMSVNKYLERIGDHAVNIGEWVEYAITGVHPKT